MGVQNRFVECRVVACVWGVVARMALAIIAKG